MPSGITLLPLYTGVHATLILSWLQTDKKKNKREKKKKNLLYFSNNVIGVVVLSWQLHPHLHLAINCTGRQRRLHLGSCFHSTSVGVLLNLQRGKCTVNHKKRDIFFDYNFC